MHQYLRAAFWILVYLALVLTPLFVLLIGPRPLAGGFWVDLSLALGFAGTAMMAVMFLLTARFQRATAPFGIDLIYYFHRLASIGAFIFILLHPLLLVVRDPALLGAMHPAVMPWHLWAGTVSFAALAALMITSLWRKQLRIHYDEWRVAHMLLAVAALVLAVAHIAGVAHYSALSWKSGLWLLIALSCGATIVYVRLVKPLQMLRRPWRVVEVIEERGSSWTLVVRPERHAGFRFLPGQFAWLTLWSSPFAMKEHPFSISSSAEAVREVQFTIKELGDFTSRIGRVKPGTRVYLDGPYGTFSIDLSRAPGYVFIAGGVGIAPVMSMLRTLVDRGDRRPLQLFYAYHTWERLTFREELAQLKEQLDLEIVYVLSEPPPDWQGETGYLSEEIFARHLPADRAARECFICGPTPMIRVAERGLARQGVPPTHIHSELFDLV
ncbi:Predicted ferric reductase [Geoalkalibacter ferrihydriticus]|uniref:Oxidoreductase n=2 Tax=Geoalkalibacter ferrihydriticus TaxID=392333 RepID=A0A0C2HSG8_9BACT|nr:ferric reductase-like transmembrane domain-containing protein [Geoalkalibacter ferrihydriticus]KIH75692.1 oxidoreductase [Geoalkalibacter ferrihydriticus DSM 17813]SDM73976.1 Predicted ferric reductase [Geoalkalibacter ferrihydriticus]